MLLLLRSAASWPESRSGNRAGQLLVATALSGRQSGKARLSPAPIGQARPGLHESSHWACCVTKHSEMKGSVPCRSAMQTGTRRLGCECFLLSCGGRSRASDSGPTAASTAQRIARAGLSTLPTPTATRRGQRQQAIRGCLLDLIGCAEGAEAARRRLRLQISVLPMAWPCTRLHPAWRRRGLRGLPECAVCGSSLQARPGMQRELGPRSPADDCPGPCRPVFPPAGSTRPPGGARRHSVLSAVGGGGQDSGCCNSAPQPGCQRAAGEPAGASCTPSVDNARWLREPLQAAVVVSTVGWPPPVQGLGTLQIPTAVAPDARNDAGAECSSAPTWRSTPLGKLYDGGAPGQA